ncbi:4,5-DOPA dioxygenase extradiol [Methylotenera sp.]|uniref:4,5-DOPA-extradiol-dioxygenase n=1 Tax=Methylotenera sp. TaxID=2051956 RepID=UPI0027159187|nr:4,5-DOPA dioxygenase extradiol [Methylotenera sp.]MDO9204295.1 4,5-DOPA dioxygenase extradiol [Methylotenera sp.]MDP1522487.1 4,5-DOPA dioxygenase extradiol [Methylotenera sp.]MDP2229863.1 4,5-DOPA dioxygenase extradiol [Methylotenera sp.]MDP3141695.1 4,5-DOPA dioxygenase extradiol [Methylotenera sp.]MDP3307300.1 4,5-DOPA dioxygenase extradiol [Methylotenera sp.]
MKNKENTTRMPAMFIGHGNPMNAITENPYREAWLALGKTLPKPNAILCISAHWQTHGTQVCVVEKPKTIHDFGGFPAELFAQQYPAPGAPEYAKMVRDLFPANTITTSQDWGLDHGAWSILQSLFPEADVPAFQLSLNVNLAFAEHFALAKQLASLREYGVMIIGSGNIVHNLARLNMQGTTPDWATNFDIYIKNALEISDEAALLDITHAGDSAKLAVPTDEHYLPLLYIAAVRHQDDHMQFLTDSFDLGSLSMRSVIYK